MTRLWRFLFLINFLFLFIALGCKEEPPKVNLGLNEKFNFSAEEYKSVFKTFAEKFELDDSIRLYFSDSLKNFYSLNDYQTVLLKSFEDIPLIDSLIELFEKANEHGLNPKRYHLAHLRNELAELLNEKPNNKERLLHLAKTELIATDAVLKYSSDLKFGALNPKLILQDSYNFPISDGSSRNLLEPLKHNSLINYLNDIQPKDPRYKKLQFALKKFESFKNSDWEKIPEPSKKIKLGDRDTLLPKIATRLITLGFLDTIVKKISDFTNYDSLFEKSVKKFQLAYGLIEDGIISKNTVDKLNTMPEDYIKKINVYLERFRWYNYSNLPKYVLVNIPDFRLYAFENGKEKFSIKVCTGRRRSEYVHNLISTGKASKQKNPKLEDWETPVLQSEISHLILNPTWTVPRSIMREEIAAKVNRDSAYLKKANFKVYKDGKQVDPSVVKVNELYSGNNSYTIIQNPGAGNALGKIKFMFDNPFGVYLHDTPTRPPFSYANRAVSHGCVRVEKPLLLAEFLLDNNSKWTLDYLKIETGYKVEDKTIISEFRLIRNELRKGFSFGQTTEVKLQNKIPVIIDYYTVWVDNDGLLNFRDDVYRQDKLIMESLVKY